MDVDVICSDEKRICTIEELKVVVEAAQSAPSQERLVYLLRSLGNFAREEKNRDALGESGAAAIASNSIEHPKDVQVLALAARLIGNMAYDHGSNRLKFLDLGVVPKLIKVLPKLENQEALRNVAGALANLASENEQIQVMIIEQGLEGLNKLLHSEFADVRSLGLRALHNVAESPIAAEKLSAGHTLSILVDFLKNYMDFDEYVPNTALEILTTLSENADVCAKLVLDHHLTLLIWGILQVKLSEDSWTNDDDSGADDEKPFPIRCSEFIIHLANTDVARHFFWEDKIALAILERALRPLEGADVVTNKLKLDVIRNLGRCFALLSLHDPAVGDIIGHLDSVIRLADNEDATVKLSGLMVLGNLARSDEHCQQLVERGVINLIVKAMQAHPGDQRILHVGLSSLRNLSIPVGNRNAVEKSGALEEAVRALSTPNQVIQYEAIGLLKCLLLEHSDLRHHGVVRFIELGGVQRVLELALNLPKEEGDAAAGAGGGGGGGADDAHHDPRVMFESTRLLCRLVADDEVQKLVGTAVFPAFMRLVQSSYMILKVEGVQALLQEAVKGQNLAEVKASLPELYSALATIDPTNQSSGALANIVLQIFAIVAKTGDVEGQLLQKVQQWCVNHPKYVPKDYVLPVPLGGN